MELDELGRGVDVVVTGVVGFSRVVLVLGHEPRILGSPMRYRDL